MRRAGDYRDDRIVKAAMFNSLRKNLINVAEINNFSDTYEACDFIIFDDRQKVVDM